MYQITQEGLRAAERIAKGFSPQLQNLVGRCERGEDFLWSGRLEDLWGINKSWLQSLHLMGSDVKARFPDSEEVRVRAASALSALYDSLTKFKRKNPQLLEKVVGRVTSPLIAEISPDTTKEAYINRLITEYLTDNSSRVNSSRVYPIVRALAFLELMKLHPEKADALAPDSAFSPNKMFREPRVRLADIEAEVAEVLPTLYSNDLVARVSRINEFVKDLGTQSDGFERNLGKYRPLRFKWREGASEAALDELYGSIAVKKDIYETIARCLWTIEGISNRSGKSSDRLPNLPVTAAQYGKLMEGIRSYAKNQMVYVFGETEGKATADTFLTRFTGLRGRVVDENLQVSYGGSTEYIPREKVRTDIASVMANTTSYLPFVVAHLDRFYQTAERINKQREARDAEPLKDDKIVCDGGNC